MPVKISPNEADIIQAMTVLSGILSVLGACLLIASFIMFKELRTYSSRLILFLSIADLGDSVGWVLSPKMYDHVTCVAQGILIQGFSLAAIFWQVAIAAYILQVNLGIQGLEKQEKWYHLVCWGIPALTIIVGSIYDIYGPAGPWCWIQHPHEWTGIIVLYIPFVIGITFTSIIYVVVAHIIHKKSSEAITEMEKVHLHHMQNRLRSRFYLFPFALGWAFGIINRIYNIASPNRQPILYGLQAFFFPLQGFWNFLMYGLTERIRGPQVITDILSNPKCRKYFSTYLAAQRAAENIDFFSELERLKAIPYGTPEWNAAAQQIVGEYIIQGAPKEINITGVLKQELGKRYTIAGFDKAEKEILDLMQQNMMYFRSSPQHANMIDELQTSEALSGSMEGRRLVSLFLFYFFFCYLYLLLFYISFKIISFSFQ
jgi:hypothetical protein